MLKVAAGYFFGRIAATGQTPLITDHSFNLDLLCSAMFDGKWSPRCGMYMRGGPGTSITVTPTVDVASLSDPDAKAMVGTVVRLSGFEFMMIFGPSNQDFDQISRDGWEFHPGQLQFGGRSKAHLVRLSWKRGTEGRWLTIRQQLKQRSVLPRP
jgi:hypothetical protein